MSSENTTVSKEALTTLKNYRLLGQSGLRVSPMGLGCMTFGKHAFGYEIGADYDESKRVAEKYLEAGGNFFDTANTYNDGESEKFLGEILKGRRDEAVIATKYTNSIRMGDPNAGGNSRKSMFQTIDRSLKSLQTDYLDLLYIHYWDYTTPAEEILRSFDDLVRSGKVHYIAVSDLPAWKIAQMNTISSLRGWPQFIGIQLEYSLLARTVEHELIPMARELGLGVIPWGPLASGLLTGKHSNPQTAESTAGRAMLAKARLNDRNQRIIDEVVDVAKQVGKSPAQVAINWVMQQPGVTSPLLGARTVNQLGDNMSALDFVLPKEHVDRLSAVSAPEPIFPYNHIKGPRFTALSTGGCSIETRYKF